MTEYVVRSLQDANVWSSITIPAFSTHGVVVTADGTVADISIDSANELLRYCTSNRNYDVQVVTTGIGVH